MLFVITRSELKDYRNRELKDFTEWSDSLSQNEGSTPIIDVRDEASALLRELRPREQEVMKLRYLDELEYEEIAAVLKESESNIRQIVSRSAASSNGQPELHYRLGFCALAQLTQGKHTRASGTNVFDR